MADVFRILADGVVRLRSTIPSTVTVSGTVVNGSATPLVRIVVAFYANNMLNPISAKKSGADGTFTFTLNGTVNTEFAFVVQGEIGENCVVHSHKKAG